jgi:putative methionine-R-sulfoxide reductase with GAF domain
LLRDEDRILGVIDIDSDSSAAFAQDDERGLRAIADVLGEVSGPHLRLPG